NTTDKIYSWIEAVRGIDVEQAMDQISYGGQSYSELLGAFTTRHPYIQDWNEDVEACLFHNIVLSSCNTLFLLA
ncbi:protein TIC 56, chloroplastic, partial [Tanacetum coccineum]